MIVIPMAGLSSRFYKAGYKKPKYMLEAHGKTLFEHAILSFKAYFDTIPFLFIARGIDDTPNFIEARCKALGIKDFSIMILEKETRGQAETVYLGLENVADDIPLTIFNIDTFRPKFIFPSVADSADGYLEVFKGKGNNWSYAKPEHKNTTKVIETAEKSPISDLCSTGLYHFSTTADFKAAFETEVNKPPSEWQKKELYIAPLYNELIKNGKEIHYHLIERHEVVFCGVPGEYTDFLTQIVEV
jgi:dTDP-glucose pyrophosphorylase